MKITAAPSRERGNPRGAVAIVASLFAVALVIALLPRDREATRWVALSARPHGVLSAFATPATADQPVIPALLPSTTLPAIGPSSSLSQPAPPAGIEGPDPGAMFTFSAPVADLPVLPARPMLAAGTPDAVMSPPAVDADGDHVVSTAFRQTGAAVRLAFRKTGEGVKTAFTAIPW